jgi:hypothetical protein
MNYKIFTGSEHSDSWAHDGGNYAVGQALRGASEDGVVGGSGTTNVSVMAGGVQVQEARRIREKQECLIGAEAEKFADSVGRLQQCEPKIINTAAAVPEGRATRLSPAQLNTQLNMKPEAKIVHTAVWNPPGRRFAASDTALHCLGASSPTR